MATLTNPVLQGVNGYGVKPSKLIYGTQLAATTDKTITVPDYIGVGQALNTRSQIIARFSYQGNTAVFVGVNVNTAAPDTSGNLVASTSVLNPTALLVNSGDVIHIYPIAQTYVTVALDFVA
jgi:hypothetical protein